jgi:hypothetical protein
MDKGADGRFLVKTMLTRIGEGIDPIEQSVLVAFNRCFQGFDHRWIRGLPQKPKKCFVSHSMSPKSGLRPINIGPPASQKGAGEISFYIGLNLRFGRAKRARAKPV